MAPDSPPGTAAAAVVIDRLFRDSADITFTCTKVGSEDSGVELPTVMAEISRELELGYRLVFDRPW